MHKKLELESSTTAHQLLNDIDESIELSASIKIEICCCHLIPFCMLLVVELGKEGRKEESNTNLREP